MSLAGIRGFDHDVGDAGEQHHWQCRECQSTCRSRTTYREPVSWQVVAAVLVAAAVFAVMHDRVKLRVEKAVQVDSPRR